MEWLSRLVPGVGQARTYRREWLSRDIGAGIVLTGLLAPAGMAYAAAAGLPPVNGLYATIVASLAYALVGPSRVLVIGPDSAIAPLISMPSSFLGGSAAAGGLALVVSIGQIGSFIGSTLIGVLRERTGGFAAPMAVIGIFLAVAAAVTLLLGRALASRARAAHSSR